MLAIKPTFEYIAINLAIKKYYQIDYKELVTCKDMPNYILFEENHSTHKINDHSHCEVQAFINSKNNNSHCEFHIQI